MAQVLASLAALGDLFLPGNQDKPIRHRALMGAAIAVLFLAGVVLVTR